MNTVIITTEGISLLLNGKPYAVARSHQNYADILAAAIQRKFDVLAELIDVKLAVAKYSHGSITVDPSTNVVTYKGTPFHNVLVTRMFDMKSKGFDILPLIRYADNLLQNPSSTAVTELYEWQEQAGMPLTEDGCFIAFKKVRADFGSFYDGGKTSNKPGTILEMPRNMVDDARNNTCSSGFHFCSYDYLPQYHGSGGIIVAVKINPRDVVSIPSDYNMAKGRACRYEVLYEVPTALTQQIVKTGIRDTAFEQPVLKSNLEAVTAPQTQFEAVKSVQVATPDYQQGYNDGVTDARKGSKRAYFIGATQYSMGYIAGFNQCLANIKLTGKKVSPTDTVAEAVARVMSATVNTSTAAENRRGYLYGYEQGKARARVMSIADAKSVTMTFLQGYQEGYRDGRGHKSRKYK